MTPFTISMATLTGSAPPPLSLRSPHNSVWLSEAAAAAAAGEGVPQWNESLHWTEKFKTYWRRGQRKERKKREKREKQCNKSDGRILNVQFVSGGQKFHCEREKVEKEKKKFFEGLEASDWLLVSPIDPKKLKINVCETLKLAETWLLLMLSASRGQHWLPASDEHHPVGSKVKRNTVTVSFSQLLGLTHRYVLISAQLDIKCLCK